MTKQAILVVDDDAAVRLTLTKFLKSLGIPEILEATNGLEAIERVKATPHLKLILLDLKMPVMDGLQALEQIKSINPQAKVVILTGYPFYGEADEAVKKWGTLDFLVKPVELDYLERIVSISLSEETPTEGPADKNL